MCPGRGQHAPTQPASFSLAMFTDGPKSGCTLNRLSSFIFLLFVVFAFFVVAWPAGPCKYLALIELNDEEALTGRREKENYLPPLLTSARGGGVYT